MFTPRTIHPALLSGVIISRLKPIYVIRRSGSGEDPCVSLHLPDLTTEPVDDLDTNAKTHQLRLSYEPLRSVCCNSSSWSQSALTSLISFLLLRSFAAVSAILRQSGTGRESLSVVRGLAGDGRSNIVLTLKGEAHRL